MSRMSRLCVPTIGTILTLEEDWTFLLHHERRNQKFGKDNFDLDLSWSDWWWKRDPVTGKNERVYNKPHEITLPAGTVLKVDRIYIRSKAKDYRDYDSVTFQCNPGLKGKAAKSKIRGRFWAKLADVNAAEVLFDPLTIPLHEYAELQAREAENDH
jgi:hypothetical protein